MKPAVKRALQQQADFCASEIHRIDGQLRLFDGEHMRKELLARRNRFMTKQAELNKALSR